ncbi:MAG: phosphoribosylanthranilate isomerase [Microcoleaceae cyanobacterium MO_207.B10]|nr:phosphoribosylanthranilate isomerase [Microcoleaceae cyanobacterium MO_207.B10]
MRVKICGITKADQGQAIARMGATALGFICVPTSPRYITPEQIRNIIEKLPPNIDKIGVFVNTKTNLISEIVMNTKLNGVQLHGEESPEFCYQLHQLIPHVEIIKALRIKSPQDLIRANIYVNHVNTVLLDAYHPDKFGGTGQTLDWQIIKKFNPNLPWLLAGGITPDNVTKAMQQFLSNFQDKQDNIKLTNKTFSGIDLSSGVETSPGDKDLAKVTRLFENLAQIKL